MTDTREYTMPNGKSIWYFDQGHHYCALSPDEHPTGRCHNRCPERVQGASTVAKNNDGSGPEGLAAHYERMTAKGAAHLIANGYEFSTKDGDEVLAALWDLDLTAGADMRRKGEAGTAAHKVLEQLCEGEMPAFSSGHEYAVIDWWKKTRPTPVYTEELVYDHEHNFAGRFDLQYGTDEFQTLLDLKTGSVRKAAVIQLNIYRIAEHVAGFRQADRLAILDTHEDGSWAEIEIPIRPTWGFTALASAQNAREMGKALTAATRTARKGEHRGNFQERLAVEAEKYKADLEQLA